MHGPFQQRINLVYLTNGFKVVLGESRKPEKLWVDRGSGFYNKIFKFFG